jgi:uncharacterized protein (DUF58 family)
MSSARFLDPAVLGRISNLEFLAKTVVEGFISGLHRSPFVGRSMDFAEYRAYMPGDDIRQIDWKLYSRSDRYYVKQFEGDTNTQVHFALDISRSMDFGTAAMSKLDYGRTLCSCLAYLASRQRDRVGLLLFDDEAREQIPPAAKHLQRVLSSLSNVQAGGSGSLEAPLLRLADRTRRRGIIVVLSDFYEPPEQVVRAVRGLKTRGNDVLLFHILDPAELELPYDETIDLEDLESGERIAMSGGDFARQYRELVQGHIEALRKRFVELGVDYTLLDTSEPLDRALHRYLAARLWSMKSR